MELKSGFAVDEGTADLTIITENWIELWWLGADGSDLLIMGYRKQAEPDAYVLVLEPATAVKRWVKIIQWHWWRQESTPAMDKWWIRHCGIGGVTEETLGQLARCPSCEAWGGAMALMTNGCICALCGYSADADYYHTPQAVLDAMMGQAAKGA